MGVAPQLFTTFGVWPLFVAGAMVNVQMRFAHQGQRSTNCLRPESLLQDTFPAAANSVGYEDQQNDEQKFEAGRADRLLSRTTERNPAETMRRAGLEERRCFITRWFSSLSR